MSALVWLESTLHKALNVYQRTVSQFVVPSRFFLNKFTEWGLDTSRFVYVPNSVDVDSHIPEATTDEAFVYFGRLVPEKGVEGLVRAVARAHVRLRIVGTGPEEARLRLVAAELGADVEFAGYLSGAALRSAIGTARAIVIPSEWYENAPLSVMEANALARPVIGADIGGIPELIRNGETGFTYRSGDEDALVDILTRVHGLPCATLRAMGLAAREWMREEFSPAAYRDRMLAIYRKLGVAAAPQRAIGVEVLN